MMTTPLFGKEAFPQFLQHLYAPGERIWLKTGHSDFYYGQVSHDGEFELYLTKGAGEERKAIEKITSAYSHLRHITQESDGGAFFIPGKPTDYPLKAYCLQSDIISAELDDGTAAEQWGRIEEFVSISGLTATVIVTSGGKSYHIHNKLPRKVDIATRTYLMQLYAIALGSDPNVVSPHQPMRIAGFLRKEKGNYQALVHLDDRAIHSVEQWLDGLRKVFAYKGLEFPDSISNEQFKLYKRYRNQGAFSLDKWHGILHPTPKQEPTKPTYLERINSKKSITSLTGETLSDCLEKAINLLSWEQIFYWEGHNWKDRNSTEKDGLCPRHDSKSGTSFTINTQTKEWYCRGCCVGGGAVQYINFQRGGAGNPTGKEWASLAKEVCSLAGVDVPEYKPEKRLNKFGQNFNFAKKDRKTVTKEQWDDIRSLHSFGGILAEINYQAKLKEEREYRERQLAFQETKIFSIVPYDAAFAEWNTSRNAVVVPVKYKRETLKYVPGIVPSYSHWIAMGEPKIIFGEGQREQLILDLYHMGYPDVADFSKVGYGKSWVSGLLNREKFELPEFNNKGEDVGGRIFFIMRSPDNPTTLTVEQNSVALVSRHLGKTYDREKLLPSGRAELHRTKDGQSVDIPANCPETNTFLKAQEVRDSWIPGGKDSPICQRCPHHSCEFLATRRTLLASKDNLRGTLDQIGNTASGNDICVIDETEQTIESDKVIKITRNDLIQLDSKWRKESPEDSAIMSWFLWLYIETLDKAKENKIPQFGLRQFEVQKLLAKVLQEIWSKNPEEIKAQYEEITEEEILIWETLAKHNENYPHPSRNIIYKALEIAFPSDNPWTIPTIEEIKQKLSKISSNNWEKIFEGYQTPEAKQQAIVECGTIDAFRYFIDSLTGGKTDVAISETGDYIITRRSYKHSSILSRFKFRLYLTATETWQNLKLKTGKKHIVVIEQEQKTHKINNEILAANCSLTINIYKGLGQNSKQKNQKQKLRETTQTRIDEGINGVISVNHAPQSQRALVTYQDNLETLAPFKDKLAFLCHWYGQTRGTNLLKDIEHLILHGLPKPNLNAAIAQYHTLTGRVVIGLDDRRFFKWYNQQVIAELIQAIGRPRAHLRPTTPITVDILAGDALSDDAIAQIKAEFPGASVQVKDIADVAPKAAAKGVRTERELFKVMVDLVKEGIKPKLEAVGLMLGVTGGRISQLVKEATQGKLNFKQLVKTLEMLLLALKAKLKFSELTQTEQHIASVLQDMGEQLQFGECTADEVAETIEYVLATYGYSKVFKAVMATPRWVLREIFKTLVSRGLDMILQFIYSDNPSTNLVEVIT